MSKLVLRDAFVEIDGVDLSRYVFDVEVNTGRDPVEVTSMGAQAREKVVGTGESKITLSVFQDFAQAVDDVLWPLSLSEETFLVRVKPTSDAISPTNPAYDLLSFLTAYDPIVGSVGQAATTDVVFVNAHPDGLTSAVEQLAYPESPDAFPDLLYPG